MYNLKSLKKELNEVVRLYKEERPHSELGNITPVKFEERLKSNPVSMKIAMELFDFEKNQNNRVLEAYTIRMEQQTESALAAGATSTLHSN